MHRFYLPDFQQRVLSVDEWHHATRVLRVKVGATISVFDGRGHEAQCRVEAAGKLTILSQFTIPPLPCRITLAQAIPKKNMDLIVQKATELGVAAIVPLISERTVKRPEASPRSERGKPDRWREIALESCKQCNNNWLPDIQTPQPARPFLDAPGSYALKLIGSLQPDAKSLKAILGNLRPTSVLIAIGPEGDFTPAELSAAKAAGWRPLSLGPLVLRSETAAMYALSILHHELQTRP